MVKVINTGSTIVGVDNREILPGEFGIYEDIIKENESVKCLVKFGILKFEDVVEAKPVEEKLTERVFREEIISELNKEAEELPFAPEEKVEEVKAEEKKPAKKTSKKK